MLYEDDEGEAPREKTTQVYRTKHDNIIVEAKSSISQQHQPHPSCTVDQMFTLKSRITHRREEIRIYFGVFKLIS